MTVVAIIPARSGSKRIPRKNIRDFYGTPMLAHTIKKIIESGLFSAVFVSTNDSEIASIAVEYGANVVGRTEELSDDYSTTSDVMRDVANRLKNEFENFELLCCIYPMNPFLNTDYISKAVSLIQNENLDFVFTVKPFESAIQRALITDANGLSKFMNPEFEHTRSQDLPQTFHDAAMFYLGKVESWMQETSPLAGKSKFLVLGKYEAVDIDDEDDWKFAKEIYRIRNIP